MTLPLTERQEALWRFIKSCERSPTYEEMSRALGYACKGQRIYDLVSALEAKGFVRKLRGGARNVVALDPQIDLAGVSTDALMRELERRIEPIRLVAA